MNFALQRLNMVESQVRPNGVTDGRILGAMGAVPRERFVPEARRGLSYADDDIPIAVLPGGTRRYLLEPMVLARLLQLADVRESDIVLDVGCGTGYSTAIAAALAESVLALEENAGLARIASETLGELGIANAAVVHGPHAQGLPAEAPFDVIFVNGRIPGPAETLMDQLKPDGRLVAVVGDGAISRGTVFRRIEGGVSTGASFDAAAPNLAGFEGPKRGFVF